MPITIPRIIALILPSKSLKNITATFECMDSINFIEVLFLESGETIMDKIQIPDFVKVYRHPVEQPIGNLIRLGLLLASESNATHVLMINPDFPIKGSELETIASNANTPVDFCYAAPKLKTLSAPLALRWMNARQALLQQLVGKKLPLLSAPLRLVKLEFLKKIPFLYNSGNSSFDLDFAIQVVSSGASLKEIATDFDVDLWRKFDPLWPERMLIHLQLKSIIKYRIMQIELFYDPKFDVTPMNYMIKEASTSIHHFMRNVNIPSGAKLLDVGGGNGRAVSLAHAEKGVDVTCIDLFVNDENSKIRSIKVDLDLPWKEQFRNNDFDSVFAMDVIEHLKCPEAGLSEIFVSLKRNGVLYASTGNVAFLPIRVMLLLGQFNYGRRGILDLTHRRLFTIASFRRILRNAGFSVEKIHAFGAPILDLSKKPGIVIKVLDRISARLAQALPGLFAFQFVAVCRRIDSPSELLPEIVDRVKGEKQTHQ